MFYNISTKILRLPLEYRVNNSTPKFYYTQYIQSVKRHLRKLFNFFLEVCHDL